MSKTDVANEDKTLFDDFMRGMGYLEPREYQRRLRLFSKILSEARETALEQAATLAESKYSDSGWDGHYHDAGRSIGAAIRGLKARKLK